MQEMKSIKFTFDRYKRLADKTSAETAVQALLETLGVPAKNMRTGQTKPNFRKNGRRVCARVENVQVNGVVVTYNKRHAFHNVYDAIQAHGTTDEDAWTSVLTGFFLPSAILGHFVDPKIEKAIISSGASIRIGSRLLRHHHQFGFFEADCPVKKPDKLHWLPQSGTPLLRSAL
ncbi:MAG: hypothetical protein AB7S81_06810 [Bdellovibrionales bacterium]